MSEKDPILETKKRARRRLVGAAALSLLAIAVLPMVMDREPRPLAEDIQIRIPSQEAMLAQPVSAKPDAAQSERAPVVAEIDGASVKSAAQGDKPTVAPKASADAVPAPKPGEAQKPAADKSPPDKAASPAKPEPNSKPDKPQKSAATEQKFVVQLGTFVDAHNAHRVQDKAKSLGIASFTETVKSDQGDKLRVRAGPFADRAAAEKAQLKLKDAGLSGVVAAK